jgi:hypothetical protein
VSDRRRNVVKGTVSYLWYDNQMCDRRREVIQRLIIVQVFYIKVSEGRGKVVQ